MIRLCNLILWVGFISMVLALIILCGAMGYIGHFDTSATPANVRGGRIIFWFTAFLFVVCWAMAYKDAHE